MPTAPMIAIDLDHETREAAIRVGPSVDPTESSPVLPPVPPLEVPQDDDATGDPGRRRRVVVLAAGVLTLVLVIAAVVAARRDGGGEASTDLAAVALAAPEGLSVAVDEDTCVISSCELVFSATDRSEGETGHIAVIEPEGAESFELPGPSKRGTGRTFLVRSGLTAVNAPFCVQLFAASGDERSAAQPPVCRLVTRNLEAIEVGDDIVLWSDLQEDDCVALLPGDSIGNAVWFRAVECAGSDGEVVLREDFSGQDTPSCQVPATGSGRTLVAAFKPEAETDADVFLCIVHD